MMAMYRTLSVIFVIGLLTKGCQSQLTGSTTPTSLSAHTSISSSVTTTTSRPTTNSSTTISSVPASTTSTDTTSFPTTGSITTLSTTGSTNSSTTNSSMPANNSTINPTSSTASPVVCGNAKLNSHMGARSTLFSEGIWPWMASLQLHGIHVCGGTLVAEQFVMTSASCFASSTNVSDWTVVLGRLKNNGSNPNELSVKVFNISFSNGTENNIAVLRLWSKPTLSDYIQPICVDLGTTNFTINTPCWAAGWGSGGGAEQTLQDFITSIVNCGNTSSSNSICTGVMSLEETNKGGPLMCKIGQSWIQAAVLTLASSSTNSSANGTSRNSISTKIEIPIQTIQTFTKNSVFASYLRLEVGSFPPQATTVDNTNSPFTTTITTVNSTNPPFTTTITTVNSTNSTFTTTITTVNSTNSTFTTTITMVNSTNSMFTNITTNTTTTTSATTASSTKPSNSSGTQSFAFFSIASVFLMSLNSLTFDL